MTCLPASQSDGVIRVLYVDDCDGRGSQAYFDTAFEMLAIPENVDRFDVRGSDGVAGNGPGSRVRSVAGQVVDIYNTILWDSGNLSQGTIGDGSAAPDKSRDAAMLAEFLGGDRSARLLYLSGDNVATQLKVLSGAGAAELRSFIEYTLVETDHSGAGFAVTPLVIGQPGGAFDHLLGPDSLLTYGGCPQVNRFDVLAASGESRIEMRYDGGAAPNDGAVISQRSVNTAGNDVAVMLSGFGFQYIRDNPGTVIPDGAEHLRDILVFRAPPVVPCPPVYLNAGLIDNDVMVTWRVDVDCIGLTSLELYRYSDLDTALVRVHPDSILEGIDDLVDVDPDRAVVNNYRLVGVTPSLVTVPLGEVDVFVPARFRALSARAEDIGVRVRWSVTDAPTIDGFGVLRRVAGGGEFTAVADTLLAPDRREFLDKTVEPGVTYEYEVLVSYTYGNTSSSDPVAVTARASLTLVQNFPNPFNPTTTIGFTIPSRTAVTIKVYNVAGRLVTTLFDGVPERAGYSEVRWDGRADAGGPAASGVYFCRMSADGRTFTRKMVLVR
jgi:hypothetical protein